MSGAEKEWVQAAMTDDMMVVDLLVRLQAATPPRPSRAPPLEWSVRQRRSRSVSISKKHSQRASPTTPLTWSGGTSLSGGSGGGGDEDSSLPFAERSKVHGHSQRIASKRTRKKKTLAELKDEESRVSKERRQLEMIELQPKESIFDHRHHTATGGPIISDNGVRSGGCREPNQSSDANFAIPDLNMPLEEDCGVS